MARRIKFLSGWSLDIEEEEQGDVILSGPGHLEIILRRFNPALVDRSAVLPPSALGELQQRSWEYPLEEGITLHLISTSLGGLANPLPQHILYLGIQVQWTLDADTAEALHQLGS